MDGNRTMYLLLCYAVILKQPGSCMEAFVHSTPFVSTTCVLMVGDTLCPGIQYRVWRLLCSICAHVYNTCSSRYRNKLKARVFNVEKSKSVSLLNFHLHNRTYVDIILLYLPLFPNFTKVQCLYLHVHFEVASYLHSIPALSFL